MTPRPTCRRPSTIDHDQVLELAGEATPETARALRAQFEQWVQTVGAAAAVAGDLGQAVYEALANAAEHAYPTDHRNAVIQLHAQVDADQVQITISDSGTWLPPSEPGYRGRGFAMMRYLANDVQVDPTPQGTAIQLRARISDPRQWHSR